MKQGVTEQNIREGVRLIDKKGSVLVLHYDQATSGTGHWWFVLSNDPDWNCSQCRDKKGYACSWAVGQTKNTVVQVLAGFGVCLHEPMEANV